MQLPVNGTDGIITFFKIESMRVFCTNKPGQNFLGISPGPESLSDYSLFSKYSTIFKDIDNNVISNIMLNVSYDQNAADTNWDLTSYLIINEMDQVTN